MLTDTCLLLIDTELYKCQSEDCESCGRAPKQNKLLHFSSLWESYSSFQVDWLYPVYHTWQKHDLCEGPYRLAHNTELGLVSQMKKKKKLVETTNRRRINLSFASVFLFFADMGSNKLFFWRFKTLQLTVISSASECVFDTAGQCPRPQHFATKHCKKCVTLPLSAVFIFESA